MTSHFKDGLNERLVVLCMLLTGVVFYAAKPNRLLISLLSSLGNSADSIAQMAVSLREELKLAQELSLSPRN